MRSEINMRRLVFLAAALPLFGSLVHAQTAALHTYPVTSWPAGFKELPCGAFRKEDDGGWTLTGTVVLKGVGFISLPVPREFGPVSNEARDLNVRCGGESSGAIR